jgi:hypothetical protein
MATENTKKNENKYCCIYCDFNTSKLTDYNRHLDTKKHIGNTLATSGNINLDKTVYKCEICNKTYTDRTGLWKHKQKCINQTIVQPKVASLQNNNDPSDKELMLALIKDNSELKNMIMEVIKNGIHNTTNNTHTNSHNKAFNLNFFLNETCKDAMNIMDFVDSIKLQLSDLENVGELGYVEGISKIIVKNLKELDVTQRPVHCTDQKRETMYIKDEDKWEKDEERLKLHKVVRRVTCKNQNLIPKI